MSDEFPEPHMEQPKKPRKKITIDIICAKIIAYSLVIVIVGIILAMGVRLIRWMVGI